MYNKKNTKKYFFLTVKVLLSWHTSYKQMYFPPILTPSLWYITNLSSKSPTSLGSRKYYKHTLTIWYISMVVLYRMVDDDYDYAYGNEVTIAVKIFSFLHSLRNRPHWNLFSQWMI